jgi:hypothetical protein
MKEVDIPKLLFKPMIAIMSSWWFSLAFAMHCTLSRVSWTTSFIPFYVIFSLYFFITKIGGFELEKSAVKENKESCKKRRQDETLLKFGGFEKLLILAIPEYTMISWTNLDIQGRAENTL